MDYFGINSTNDLPKIKEVLAEQLVEPTIITKTGEDQPLAENEHTEPIDQETINETNEESGKIQEEGAGETQSEDITGA